MRRCGGRSDAGSRYPLNASCVKSSAVPYSPPRRPSPPRAPGVEASTCSARWPARTPSSASCDVMSGNWASPRRPGCPRRMARRRRRMAVEMECDDLPVERSASCSAASAEARFKRAAGHVRDVVWRRARAWGGRPDGTAPSGRRALDDPPKHWHHARSRSYPDSCSITARTWHTVSRVTGAHVEKGVTDVLSPAFLVEHVAPAASGPSGGAELLRPSVVRVRRSGRPTRMASPRTAAPCCHPVLGLTCPHRPPYARSSGPPGTARRRRRTWLTDWLHLLARWFHLIVGPTHGRLVLLQLAEQQRASGSGGPESGRSARWCTGSVHGGAFYQVSKFKGAPSGSPTRCTGSSGRPT